MLVSRTLVEKPTRFQDLLRASMLPSLLLVVLGLVLAVTVKGGMECAPFLTGSGSFLLALKDFRKPISVWLGGIALLPFGMAAGAEIAWRHHIVAAIATLVSMMLLAWIFQIHNRGFIKHGFDESVLAVGATE